MFQEGPGQAPRILASSGLLPMSTCPNIHYLLHIHTSFFFPLKFLIWTRQCFCPSLCRHNARSLPHLLISPRNSINQRLSTWHRVIHDLRIKHLILVRSSFDTTTLLLEAFARFTPVPFVQILPCCSFGGQLFRNTLDLHLSPLASSLKEQHFVNKQTFSDRANTLPFYRDR